MVRPSGDTGRCFSLPLSIPCRSKRQIKDKSGGNGSPFLRPLTAGKAIEGPNFLAQFRRAATSKALRVCTFWLRPRSFHARTMPTGSIPCRHLSGDIAAKQPDFHGSIAMDVRAVPGVKAPRPGAAAGTESAGRAIAPLGRPEDVI